MIQVAGSREVGVVNLVRRLRVKHVLRVVVDEESLFLRESNLGNETSDSQLLDDLTDVKLLIKALLGTGLKGIRSDTLVPATETPGAREILLAEEVLHVVLERLAAIFDLSQEVLPKGSSVSGSLLISTRLVFLFILDVVVQLFGHGVIKLEFLVCAEEIARKTKDKTKVSSQSLESIRDGFTGGVDCLCLATLSELHGEITVLGVNIVLGEFSVYRHGENSVESIGDIIGGDFHTWVPLGQVSSVDEFVVSEIDIGLNNRVSLALEGSIAELNALIHKLRIQVFVVSKEVL